MELEQVYLDNCKIEDLTTVKTDYGDRTVHFSSTHLRYKFSYHYLYNMREPHNEQDLVFLIGRHLEKITSETPLDEIEFHDDHLDATGVFDGDEVETKGNKFFKHEHDQDKFDLVICWENNRSVYKIGEFDSRKWKGKSDNPAFEDVGIDVLELSDNKVYWSD